MPKSLKEFIFKYVLSPLLAVLITLAATGVLGQNQKITESASKEDVSCATNEMKIYADKGDISVVKYVDVRIASEAKLRDSQYTTIIGMLNIILDNKQD